MCVCVCVVEERQLIATACLGSGVSVAMCLSHCQKEHLYLSRRMESLGLQAVALSDGSTAYIEQAIKGDKFTHY